MTGTRLLKQSRSSRGSKDLLDRGHGEGPRVQAYPHGPARRIPCYRAGEMGGKIEITRRASLGIPAKIQKGSAAEMELVALVGSEQELLEIIR